MHNPIAIGDEVIYPADNPRSTFIARVTGLDPDGLIVCEPVTGGISFKCRPSDLRPNRTEGT